MRSTSLTSTRTENRVLVSVIYPRSSSMLYVTPTSLAQRANSFLGRSFESMLRIFMHCVSVLMTAVYPTASGPADEQSQHQRQRSISSRPWRFTWKASHTRRKTRRNRPYAPSKPTWRHAGWILACAHVCRLASSTCPSPTRPSITQLSRSFGTPV